jgi:hypothetical protein
LSIFASSAERGFPHPDQGSNRGDVIALSFQQSDLRRRRFTLGGYAAGRIRS